MFQLKLLGALSLQDGTSPVPSGAQQKRRLALLALLAMGDDRGISRDRLQCYLWPESPGSRARHALDQLIYATRQSLGADPILSQGQELRLDPSVIDTDLRVFGDAIKDGRLAYATAIYRGPLLGGFHIGDSRELESWIDSERARLETGYRQALESLARQAVLDSDPQAAIGWWLKLSSSDPLSSRIAVEVVRFFIGAGDHAAAIRHARSYQQLVTTELEVDPDPAIEKLVADLPRSRMTEPPRQRIPAHSSALGGVVEPEPYAVAHSILTEGTVRRRTALVRGGALAVAIVPLIVLVGSFGVFSKARDEPHVRAAGASSAKAHLVNSEAKAYYLRGLNSWNDRSKFSLDTAVVYFRKAIESEPDYVEANAGLANAYVMIGYSGFRPADAMFPKAKAAALRAIDLDGTIAAPYAALGMELTWERKFNAAETAYRKAIALDANYATAHQWYGILLMILSRTSDAVAETRRAAELDPLSLQIQNNYATFLSVSGQPEAALRHYQNVVGEEPDSAWVRRNPWLLTNMSKVYAANGQLDKALRFAERAVEILPDHPRALNALASVYFRMGRPDLARQVFSRANVMNEHYSAYRGFMYAKDGQPDSAFAWFDRVREWGIPILISLPELRRSPSLRDDPRLRALFDRLGLPFVALQENQTQTSR